MIGRQVKNPLVYDEVKGCWIEQKPVSRHSIRRPRLTPEEVEFINASFGSLNPICFRLDGHTISAGEFTVKFLKRFPHPEVKAATIHRYIDQVILDSGNHNNTEARRGPHMRSLTGTAQVPLDLKETL